MASTELDSDTVKALTLQYWRYDRQHSLVILEYDGADVLTVSKDRFLYEVEVKVSIADLRRDIAKAKHFILRERLGLDTDGVKAWQWQRLLRSRSLYPGLRRPKPHLQQFYFAVPLQLEDKARAVIDELYPYAGLLTGRLYDEPGLRYGVVELSKRPRRLDDAQRLPVKALVQMVKAQSATITRLALAGARKENSNGNQGTSSHPTE